MTSPEQIVGLRDTYLFSSDGQIDGWIRRNYTELILTSRVIGRNDTDLFTTGRIIGRNDTDLIMTLMGNVIEKN